MEYERQRWDVFLYLPGCVHVAPLWEKFDIAVDAACAIWQWFADYMPQRFVLEPQDKGEDMEADFLKLLEEHRI